MLCVSEITRVFKSQQITGQTLANKKSSESYLALLIVSFIISFSLPASAEYDRPPGDLQTCIGIARVLEVLAKDQEDASAAEKYRVAKNKFIQGAGVNKMDSVGIVIGAMQSAASTRENEGISAEELRARYEIIFTEKCEQP